MAEKTGDRKAEGQSWRWRVVAAAGLLLILGTLLWRGIWASAAIAFITFLVLAYGKPYRRYRKFIYRGVLPAGCIILLVSFALDWLLPEIIPNPVTRLFFSLAMAVPCGTLPVLAVIHLYGLARLHWVTALSPNLDHEEALGFLKSLYLGLNFPVMIVSGGQPQTTREGGPGGFLQKLGGPGLIFVNHGNAAVMESGGKFTQVVKGGAKFLELYESPRAIVDLRRQRKMLSVNNVYTRDGVSLTFELQLWYQIRRTKSPQSPASKTDALPTGREQPKSDETVGPPDYVDMAMQKGEGAKPPAGDDKFLVLDQEVVNAVYRVDNWCGDVESMAGNILRDVIAERNLDVVYEYDRTQGQFLPRAEIRQVVLHRLNQYLENEQWGVEVVWVDIGSIVMPESASNRMLEKWLAEWENKIAVLQKEATISRGEAEAAALSTQETARARASMQMISMIFQAVQEAEGLSMPPGFDRVIELRLIDALEKMAAEHVNGMILPSDLLGILDSRARILGGTQSSFGAASPHAGVNPDNRSKPTSSTPSGNGSPPN
jgi:hypothetical protein